MLPLLLPPQLPLWLLPPGLLLAPGQLPETLAREDCEGALLDPLLPAEEPPAGRLQLPAQPGDVLVLTDTNPERLGL